MRLPAVFLSLVCLVFVSCTTYRLVPLGDAETELKLNRGNQVANALKERIGVSASADIVGNLIYFHIVVTNFRDNSIYVDDAHATLSEEELLDPTSNTLLVYRADEYYQKRKKEILTGQVLMAVTAAMSAADAGRTTTRTTTRYYSYQPGRNRYYRVYGTYTSTTYSYDSARAAMQREIAFANVREYVNGTNQELDYLQDTLFYPSDIAPGAEYYGIIVSEFGKTNDTMLHLDLDFAGVPFKFTFEKQKFQYQ
jgi:hypothetical protein